MKIIFMGTPDFAVPCLQKLISSEHEIVAVYTAAPKPAGRGKKLRASPVQIVAEENNLNIKTPKSLKTEELPECDMAIVAAYGLLLPKHVLQTPKYGCLNIHPSDLPRWRGAAPIQRTIMAGDKKTAICIMQMDEGLDTGDIVAREDLLLDDNITASELHDKCAERGAEMVLEVLADIDNMKPVPQSDEGVTYAAKISKDDMRVDWQKAAHEIYNQIRAVNPYFEYENERIKIFSAEIIDMQGKAGEVLDNELAVACGQRAIRILKLQKPGKKPILADEFLRGNAIPPKTCFI
ncbi:MAG: methionyl-tRNA formyltransferase [Alphaproteobacteria bacterium CG11_big_fil_rev_8_21_14_0_20_44_7]|nr:MAG: methionyl-tRNA formyltransferase [Alphaproteobacteria bacterium CG11_big_fil_rev_8_21_14_0_20_44_7]